ncbi:MAG TPA: PHP domain-containing protein, partial [Candidatus Acidoferrales bacterium]|nr:PHP domain-containing protein [Candidatus Acidoferrales bacterium]
MPGYAELHCWSNFTFLEGAAHPEELVERAAALGLAGLALTDRDGLYGAVRFTKAAAEPGFPAICGAELSVALPRPSRLVLLVENAGGYANLVELISIAQMRGRKRDARLHLDDLDGRTAGLITLSGWRSGLPERALLEGDEREARAICARL